MVKLDIDSQDIDGVLFAQSEMIASVRVKKTLAGLLAEVPSYVKEATVLRQELRDVNFLPKVLADIVGTYATPKWHDELMAIWKMASTSTQRYSSLLIFLSNLMYQQIYDHASVLNMLKLLGVDKSFNAGKIAKNCPTEYLRSRVGQVADAIHRSSDQYKMDTSVLDAFYLLILLLDHYSK